MDYSIHLLIMVLLYGLLAMSLSIVTNWGGVLSLAQGALFGVGAYASAIVSVLWGVPPILSMLVAIAIGGLAGALLSLIASNVRANDFILVIFAFQLIFVDLLKGLPSLTGGNNGLRIDSIWSFPQLEVQLLGTTLFVTLIFSLVCLFAIYRLNISPMARAFRALGEDEKFSLSRGHSSLSLRIKFFYVCGAIAAGVGAIYAHYVGYIDPSTFGLSQSIYILSMVLLAGRGNIWLPFLGATILVLFPELLRFVGFPYSYTGYIREILYGVIILFVIWRNLRASDVVNAPRKRVNQ